MWAVGLAEALSVDELLHLDRRVGLHDDTRCSHTCTRTQTHTYGVRRAWTLVLLEARPRDVMCSSPVVHLSCRTAGLLVDGQLGGGHAAVLGPAASEVEERVLQQPQRVTGHRRATQLILDPGKHRQQAERESRSSNFGIPFLVEQ